MKLPNPRPHTRRSDGFTLVEVMVAVTVAMILLFGTLYSASESLAVVEEGDRRVQTVAQAQAGLDRMLGDCRYAQEVVVTGDAATGWDIVIQTSSPLDPPTLRYSWDPLTDVLTLSDGFETQTVLENVHTMEMQVETELIGGFDVATAMYMTFGMDTSGPGFNGNPETVVPLEFGGSVKIRN